jgi:polyisoprenoid-binding protein YceI
MSKLFLSALLAIVFAAAAIAGNPGSGPIFKVKTDKSTIAWVGKKVTGKHNGTVNIKEGSLTLHDGVLTGGSFNIDMTSITVLDLQGEGKAKLENHLKSDDFFGVQKHPTATLYIKNAASKGNGLFDVTADLSIKGITKEVTFPVQLTFEGTLVKATADFKIDRSQFDVRYGSGKFFDNLGDKTIFDDFELSVSLVAGE